MGVGVGVGVGVVGATCWQPHRLFPMQFKGRLHLIPLNFHFSFLLSQHSSENFERRIFSSRRLEVCDIKLELWGLRDLGLLRATIYTGDDA